METRASVAFYVENSLKRSIGWLLGPRARPGFRQAARVKSALCVPLMLRDRLSGVIYIDSRSPENLFDSDPLQLVTAIAGLASLAWENVRHLDESREENKCLREEINLNHELVDASVRTHVVYELIRRLCNLGLKGLTAEAERSS